MSRPTPDPYSAICPSRKVIEMIGDKWSLLILPVLMEGPQRNAQLMRRVQGISQKMLTQTLKSLEAYNLIVRCDYQEVPPRVDYSLTPLGESLVTIIAQLDMWVVENYYSMKEAQ